MWIASKPSHADGKQVNANVSVGPQGVPCKGQQLASILTLLRIQQEFKATLKLEYKYMFAEKCASMHVHLFLLSTLKLFQMNVLRAAKPYCNLLKTFKFKVFSFILSFILSGVGQPCSLSVCQWCDLTLCLLQEGK